MTLLSLFLGYQCIVPINSNPPGIVLKEMPKISRKVVLSVSPIGEVDREFRPAYVPNDPFISQQWYLGRGDIYAAWDQARGNQVVAGCDTGLFPHPDINAVPGWNVYDQNSDTSEVYRHGTAVAGVAGAIADNQQGIAGVGFGVRIMPVRVSSPTGGASASNIAAGIIWAVDHGARVVYVPYAAYVSGSVWSAADYARTKGVVIVMSSGNDNQYILGDNHPTIVVVGSSDENDARSGFSNYGPPIDVLAPGQNIFTTDSVGGYNYWQGTSFSAPWVAGVLALCYNANPSLTPDQAVTCLFESDTRDDWNGHGRVSAMNAVLRAKTFVNDPPPPPPTDSEPPSLVINNPKENQIVKHPMSVELTVSDNVGVASVQVSIPGATKTVTNTSGRIKMPFNIQKLAKGTFTITAVAKDTSGNETTKLVNVTKK